MCLKYLKIFMNRKEVCSMDNLVLQSIYAKNIKNFILLKKSLGIRYKKQILYLQTIDKLAVQLKEKGPGLTKEFCDIWLNNRPNELPSNRYDRCTAFRHFSSYLNDVDIDSYIPHLPRYKKSDYIPYIYSEDEILAIFNASDNLRSPIAIHTGLFSIPMIIRFLYATGVRIGEALSIKNNDVNLDERYVKITDGKNLKERLIPISNSVKEALETYVSYKNHLSTAFASDYFFVKTDGMKLSQVLVRTHFKRCLEIVGLFGDDNFTRHRIHDLRHTFAVNALSKIIEEGNDAYVALPILSSYLGHTAVSATNTYIRLTANKYPEIIKDIDLHIIDVFPKNENL